MGSAKNIVWIASYPKSGNTWVRFLCCNLLYGLQESASSLNVLAPDIHELKDHIVATQHAGLVKTHFAYSAALPLVERTAAVIYVVRNPADVLFSNFHYAARSGGAQGAAAFENYFDEYLHSAGDPRWIPLGMGSWVENVISWIEPGRGFPVITLRYEDLSADPVAVSRLLAQMLRPHSTAEEIARAAANSSFQRMQEIESADIREKRLGIFYKPYLQPSIDAGSRFMRSGSVGEGAARLTASQRARLNAKFGSLLATLGYPPY